jgi:hypothetical protein
MHPRAFGDLVDELFVLAQRDTDDIQPKYRSSPM